MKYIYLAVVLAACSGEAATWGDVSEEIAEAVCWKSYKCGVHDDIGLCAEHEIYHLCELDNNCGDSVHGSVDLLTYQCASAIYDGECGDGWPENCLHAFKHLRPDGLAGL